MKIIYSNQLDSNYKQEYPRDYLEDFLPEKTYLLFSDYVLDQNPDIHSCIQSAGDIDGIIIDITHNPVGMTQNRFNIICQGQSIATVEDLAHACSKYSTTVVLGTDYVYKSTTVNYFYFPIWIWMWSSKLPLWFSDLKMLHNNKLGFESKTQGLLCLNGTAWWHRAHLFNEIVEKSWFSKITYTFGSRGLAENYSTLTEHENKKLNENKKFLPFMLPDESLISNFNSNDVSVHHSVWSTHAFNLVTETSMTEILLSEKTCKAFIAKQIPILIGPINCSQYLESIGLDMFSDIVPWKTWDHLSDPRQRINAVVDFLDSFMQQDLLALYYANKHRVDRNLEFFHSEQFRSNIMQDMIKLSSSSKTD